MQHWVDTLHYGNQDISGGKEGFWLDGELRISATEQIELLSRLRKQQLPLSDRTQRIVIDIMKMEQSDDYVLRGKTGWVAATEPQLGWWVACPPATLRRSRFRRSASRCRCDPMGYRRRYVGVMTALACSVEAPRVLRAEARISSESAQWRALPVVPDAVERMAHVLVFDTARSRHIIFGGRPVNDSGQSLSDGWTIDGDGSFDQLAGYARRGFVRGAFDARRARTVVFGGADLRTTSPVGPVYTKETWELDDDTWHQASVPTSPPERSSHGLSYDSARDVTVLFGGYDGAWKDDLWAYDGATWTQACTVVACEGEPRPAARANPVLVYDEARAVTLLFGGSANGRGYSDTWTWDGERWDRLDPAHTPTARDAAAATYDPVTKRVLLFGGASEDEPELGDLWVWDGTDWSLIESVGKPVARRGAGMVWDAARRSATLFGGAVRRTATDAWQLQITGNVCESSQDCHAGACIAGVCGPDGSGGSPQGTAGSPPAATGSGGSEPQSGAPPDGSEGGGVSPGAGGAADEQSSEAHDDGPRSLYSCSAPPRSAGPVPPFAWGGLLVWLLIRPQRRGRIARSSTCRTT